MAKNKKASRGKNVDHALLNIAAEVCGVDLDRQAGRISHEKASQRILVLAGQLKRHEAKLRKEK